MVPVKNTNFEDIQKSNTQIQYDRENFYVLEI